MCVCALQSFKLKQLQLRTLGVTIDNRQKQMPKQHFSSSKTFPDPVLHFIFLTAGTLIHAFITTKLDY